MDTMRLALSPKQLAAIPDAPPDVVFTALADLQITVTDLQTLVLRLQREVVEIQAELKRRH